MNFKKLIFIFALILATFSLSFAFKIKKLDVYRYNHQILVNIFYKDFPFQQLVLALKSQDKPIFINYEFSVYKKRFLLRDILLYKETYSQKLYYDVEKNLYYVEDKFNTLGFEKAEDAVLSVINLQSYPLEYKLPSQKNKLILKVKAEIFYTTHLSDGLRYTKKRHRKKLKASKKISLNGI